MIPALFEHQQKTVEFLEATDCALISSDPGTGKTRCIIEYLSRNKLKAVVFAPKSILQPSWALDIEKFAPHLTYAVAEAKNRREAFEQDVDIVLTNHDAAKWLDANIRIAKKFDVMVVDESTAYKNPNAMRSKAIEGIAEAIPKRINMTGTPTPNGILDLFHQIKILDGGQRLGSSFWKFRAMTHDVKATGGYSEWVEKEGIQDAVYGLISDINIRYKLEDCISMPENVLNEIRFTLNPKHQADYDALKKNSILTLKESHVNAVNKAVLANKLLQLAAGSIYDSGHQAETIDPARYELIIELILQRDQCVVAFNWQHQKEELVKWADKAGISYAVIDGSVPVEKRNLVVASFQRGEIKAIFAHPKTAGHGLTLTKGTTTIWSSPTYNAEHYVQFNRRIYRAGQTQRTETIHLIAANTIDELAYDRLTGKIDKMKDLLELLEA